MPTSEPAPTPSPWAPGVQVGRYALLAKIAMGGMAEIWIARQTGVKGFEKVIVVKRILDTFCKDEEFVEMFLDEARIAVQLAHPSIVQILDLGSHADAYYMAMEYLSGEPLSRVIRGGVKAGTPLPIQYAVKLIAQAAEALGYAHSRIGVDGKPLNIVHRDVSPQNLVVTYDGNIKIVDFGIAKAANRTTQTQQGKFKGKLEYMAPEQARGQKLDHRVDLFALGIVLWESLSRKRLLVFDDPVRTLSYIVGNDPFPSPATRNPDVPDDLAAIVAKALERDPAKRFQSGVEFQLALEGWLRTNNLTPSAADVATYMRTVFADRLDAQTKLLESARTGELAKVKVPTSVSDVSSMPGGTQPGKSKTPVYAGIGAVAALVLIVGVGFALRSEPEIQPLPPMAQLEPPPVPTVGSIAVQSSPVGAKISIDGEELGVAPLTIPDLQPGVHKLVATLEGHDEDARELEVTAGEKLSVAFMLRETREEAPPVQIEQTAKTDVKVTRAAPRGKLSVVTKPWSEVYLGKRKLGHTPLVNVTMPVGKHTLRLFNPEVGKEKKIAVEVRANQITTVKENL